MQSKEKFKIQDHLHTRGEYSEAIRPTGKDSGSPPHTWRILILYLLTNQLLRITSTHVENTASRCKRSRAKEDHLHTRGEYNIGDDDTQLPLGSPPHTWRILMAQYGKDVNGRITSTHVENTT